MFAVSELPRNSLNNAVRLDVCPHKTACPHLEGRDCGDVLAELGRFKAENRDLREVFDVAAESFKKKEAEVLSLKEENNVLREKFRDLARRPFARNIALEDETAGEQSPQPEQSLPEITRKKRGAPKGHRGATRQKPDRLPDKTVLVEPEECPHCHSRDISPCKDTEDHFQEDIVIARPVLTRFVKRRGYCRNCGKSFFPQGKDERPKGYLGPMALALAGYMRYVIKVPFEGTRKLFSSLWNLDISRSALVGFDKKLARSGKGCYEHLADMARVSSSVHVDETSWPCGSLTEWLWAFVNKEFAFFKIAPSRAGAVPASVLGEHYGGVLISDCFSAYNTLLSLAKQKCLSHYEKDANNLGKFFPGDRAACVFAECLKDICKRARQTKREWKQGVINDEHAHRLAEDYEEEVDQLTESPLENRDADNLRKRLIAHRDENFTFLRFKEVDPDNNRVERALRPSVVSRKISYGNDSETGARNHEILMSLVETAKLHVSNAGGGPLEVMNALALGKDLEGVKQAVFGYWDTS